MLLESFSASKVFPIPTGSTLDEILGLQCFYFHSEDDTRRQIVFSLVVFTHYIIIIITIFPPISLPQTIKIVSKFK